MDNVRKKDNYVARKDYFRQNQKKLAEKFGCYLIKRYLCSRK